MLVYALRVFILFLFFVLFREEVSIRKKATLRVSKLVSFVSHNWFKTTLFIRTKTQHANVQGNPLDQATKRHLDNG